ncbi:LLM class F420-dependent oxidoreductase [Acrocarpospora phusangensis]|uniref:LLM class F420-dependent oxidoreductase n=1 Tax=Acrocarpospora phusangensis TaxID=1070424 RepID=A0A919QBQ8_9ACTN|nr:LLM class F420-dependent oxidoreductase [Acrocarpospora phusangensis]GIH24435.1 LLM class F420-dependent oxidoreductase [Acrocarpospora phusangensis]
MAQRSRFGTFGIWSAAWTNAHREEGRLGPEFAAAAAELDALGFGTLWLGASPAVPYAAPVLEATRRITVATGICSIWSHPPDEVAADRAALARAYPGRFVLGLGVSHEGFVKAYARPYEAMRDYLTALDEAAEPVPAADRVLAALGPRMLALARDRSAGAHPYLVTPGYTRRAREILGAEALLAPELMVVLDGDPEKARALARQYLSLYLGLPNYTRNLRRIGFDDTDFMEGGSDRLVDALFAIGDADGVAVRAAEFLAAGADHIAIQVVSEDPEHDLPREAWRQLAAALPLDA